jgi:hypothetical protein
MPLNHFLVCLHLFFEGMDIGEKKRWTAKENTRQDLILLGSEGGQRPRLFL